MKHEIKLRAWEKKLKRMMPVDSIDFERKMINVNSAWRMFNEVNFMLYAGLNDKKGKDIYALDIVKADNTCPEYWVVEFIEGGFCLTNPTVENYPMDICMFYPSVGCQLEIIGNIYENPELLSVIERA